MANSRYEYHKKEEQLTDLRFNRDTYIIVRIDGHKFHAFTDEHGFHKPNDKRALDLMVHSAKQLMKTYKGQIPLAYGYSDEFSFMIKSSSNLLSRRIFKITSMLPVIFATAYNSGWNKYFSDPDLGHVTTRKYDAWFDARPKEYANYRTVIDYFRWRQIDCHINNLYNTTLHALTGRYMRHKLIQKTPDSISETRLFDNGSYDGLLYELKRKSITDWMPDAKFMTSPEATEKLSGTVSSDKHDIMYLQHKINYNDELEQFKKGTLVVDTQKDFSGGKDDHESIKHYSVDLLRDNKFWEQNSHIFDDYVTCPPLK